MPPWILLDHGLIDEFQLSLTRVASGRGGRLFGHLSSAPQLHPRDVTKFDNGVLLPVYTPR